MKIQVGVVFGALLLAEVAFGQQRFEPGQIAQQQAIRQGQIKEYLAAMEQLGLESEKKERWSEAAEAYVWASTSAGTIGQYQKMLSYATKAIELARRGRDAWNRTHAMQNLAAGYRRLGQANKEREWLEKALESAKEITTGGGEGFQARLYAQLGMNLLRQGEVQKAIENISFSVQIQESYLARYKSVRGRPTPDIISRQEAALVGALEQLGSVHLRAGNVREAISAFDRGMAIVRSSNSRNPAQRSLIPLMIGTGQAQVAQRDYPRALENFTKALQMAEAGGQTAQIESASNAIGNLLLQSQRESEAIPYFKKSIDSIESARSLLDSEEFRTSFFGNKGQTYGGIILANLAAQNIADAFNYNERARSRAFLDILGSKVQLVKERALAEDETFLRTKLSELRGRLAAQREDNEDAVGGSGRAQQRAELEAAEKAYGDFLTKVRKENKEQASLINVEPLTLKQLQELIDPGVTVLEYFVVGGSAVLWIVDKGRAEFVRLSLDRQELVSKVTAFRESISQLGEPEKLNQQSQGFYKLLIEPALPHIRGKELLIIPHDVLHYLPFQALLSPQGKYLIEDYAINYLSSASLMQFTQEKRKARGELTSILAKGGNVLTFGNPDLGDPKMSLAFAGIEAKEIKSLYPESTVYLETEATEERAKSLVGSNDIVHFASHAELSEDDPLSSAILLARSDKEDGRLEVREIFGMDLKASLVVLSACETGLGKLSSGDELVGLTRAFIYAGTPSVVASLWNVEDSSTAQLMASFYKNLKTMTKVEALRQAQLQLIKGNVNSELLERRGIGGVGKLGETANSKLPAPVVSTSHPYFWAPFILVGEGK